MSAAAAAGYGPKDDWTAAAAQLRQATADALLMAHVAQVGAGCASQHSASAAKQGIAEVGRLHHPDPPHTTMGQLAALSLHLANTNDPRAIQDLAGRQAALESALAEATEARVAAEANSQQQVCERGQGTSERARCSTMHQLLRPHYSYLAWSRCLLRPGQGARVGLQGAARGAAQRSGGGAGGRGASPPHPVACRHHLTCSICLPALRKSAPVHKQSKPHGITLRTLALLSSGARG